MAILRHEGSNTIFCFDYDDDPQYVAPDHLSMLGKFFAMDGTIQKIALKLCQERGNAPEEPDPQIDFVTLHTLIGLCQNHVTKREKKVFEYVADCRKAYFVVHAKFQDYHRGLTDLRAYAQILDEQRAQLLTADPADGVKLAENLRQRKMNDMEVRKQMAKVWDMDQKRRSVTTWYSSSKAQLLKMEVPRMMLLGKQAFEYAMAREGTFTSAITFWLLEIIQCDGKLMRFFNVATRSSLTTNGIAGLGLTEAWRLGNKAKAMKAYAVPAGRQPSLERPKCPIQAGLEPDPSLKDLPSRLGRV